MPPRPPSASPSTPFLTDVSRFLGAFRWAFMPLGLVALVAVGVHSAADTLDERLLSVVDRVDAAFDAFVGRFELTAPLVEWVSLEQRTRIARFLALAWELCADLVLALPALGYREASAPAPVEAWRAMMEPQPVQPTWRALWTRCWRKPTPMRWLRPLATAAVVLAGACAVAKLIQGSVYLSWRELFGDAAADVAARVLALAGLVGVLASLGWRAVLRNLQHADAVCEEAGGRRAWRQGLLGCGVVVPLAVAAAVDATPLWSFFR
ncbi:hypothetical protein [Comamonas sp. JC664]|uniref:hypothetical protein n=1 Tax=Comamonas sp. JC664 TaxID=2801917 RepID=UPI00174C822A|nr:hypothetical protein [Comamonas sp. JC664]MBL0692626.1 hypothetical protein [Comamonas sp. JC664]GHG92991.1 hypothetical protein GCM10012319_54920 [Comamonas sp. KCTC 72670]